MTGQDIMQFINSLLVICGVISVIAGAFIAITNVKNILNKDKNAEKENIEKQLERHDKDIDILKQSYIGMQHDIKENKAMTVMIFKGVKSLMDNAISGNGIENLKKVRGELDNYLIEKNGDVER